MGQLLRKKLIFSVILICLSISIQVQAEGLTNLTLKQAIEIVVKNNKQLKTVQKKYQQQKQELKLSKSKYPFNWGWDLIGNYNLYEKEEWLGTIADSTELRIINQFSPQQELVLEQQLLELDNDQLEWEGSQGSLAYNYYLFKDYNPTENQQLTLLRKEISVLEAKQQLDDFREGLKSKIVSKYHQLLKLQKKLLIKQEMLNQSELTLQTVKAKIKAGNALQLNQKEAALEVKEVELNIEELRAEYKLALRELEQELKIALPADVNLKVARLKNDNYSKAEIKAKTLANSLELQLLEEQITKQKYQVKKITNDKDFNLGLIGELKWQKEDAPQSNYRLGIKFDYQFNNHQQQLEQLAIKQNQTNLAELQQKLTEKRKNLKLEVDRTWLKFNSYKNRIELYQQLVKELEERLEIKRRKYKAGFITLTELLAIQVDLSQKKVDYLNNLINCKQQLYQLKKLQGEL